MFSSSKKNDDRHNGTQGKKSTSLDALESEFSILNKSELGKMEGGKDAKKTLNDSSGLRNSIGGSIPLWTNYVHTNQASVAILILIA